MNNYSISMKINGEVFNFTDDVSFRDVFEKFAAKVEYSNFYGKNIDEPVLTYKDRIIATDIPSICKIGTDIAGFDIALYSLDKGTLIDKGEAYYFLKHKYTLNVPSTTMLHISVIGMRSKPYIIFVESKSAGELFEHFMEWDKLVEKTQRTIHNYNLELEYRESQKNSKVVDTDWEIPYHVHTELKNALALIDTNPEETKKILMVMDYMLSKGKK